MHSSRVRLMPVALLAVFALCAVATATAQAEEAPFWSIKGTRLAAGQTRYITGKRYIHFIIDSPALRVRVICAVLKFKEGVILGSNAGEPGRNDEIMEFENCIQEGNGLGEPDC